MALRSLALLCAVSRGGAASLSGSKPNILVIMGDDIGWFNTSAYNSGIMGYTTPNIDSIAQEGIRFTDAYGQQSCTAGRAAFITGQSPKRTGMLKIGMPGDPIGMPGTARPRAAGLSASSLRMSPAGTWPSIT